MALKKESFSAGEVTCGVRKPKSESNKRSKLDSVYVGLI